MISTDREFAALKEVKEIQAALWRLLPSSWDEGRMIERIHSDKINFQLFQLNLQKLRRELETLEKKTDKLAEEDRQFKLRHSTIKAVSNQ